MINGLLQNKWTTISTKKELKMMKESGMKYEAEVVVREIGELVQYLEKQIAIIERRE